MRAISILAFGLFLAGAVCAEPAAKPAMKIKKNRVAPTSYSTSGPMGRPK